MTRHACFTAIGLLISGCATATVVDDDGESGESGAGESSMSVQDLVP